MAKGNQPRVPAGSSSGGQFAGGFGGFSGAVSGRGNGGGFFGGIKSALAPSTRSVPLRHQIAQKKILKKLSGK